MGKRRGEGAVGASMSIIINTLSKEQKERYVKKGRKKDKRAKTCLSCDDNATGFCEKHKEWCARISYLCTGEKDPYYRPLFPVDEKNKNETKKKNKNREKGKRKNSYGH